MADRPWRWPDHQPYTLGLVIDRAPHEAKTTVSWAILRDPQPKIVASGEEITPFEHSAADVIVRNFRRLKALYPNRDGSPHIVQLYRYTKKSWPRSVAAAEGGTRKEHEAKLRAVAAALKYEGAVVRIKTV